MTYTVHVKGQSCASECVCVCVHTHVRVKYVSLSIPPTAYLVSLCVCVCVCMPSHYKAIYIQVVRSYTKTTSKTIIPMHTRTKNDNKKQKRITNVYTYFDCIILTSNIDRRGVACYELTDSVNSSDD